MPLLVAGLGLLTGLLSGLFGIGGGIVMAPLLLFVPPALGFEPLPMRAVAGLTVVQGLAASVSGALTHRYYRQLSDRLAMVMGAAIFVAAALGGAAAKRVSDTLLLAVFAALATAAAVLMLAPAPRDRDPVPAAQLDFSRPRAVAAASGVGLLGGLVGQGGSFLLIPLMTSFVQVPTRIAIGTNLGIVLLSTLAATLAKAATGQIDWRLALPLLAAVVPATHLGGRLSRRLPVPALRRLLAVLIGLAALRIWLSVLL